MDDFLKPLSEPIVKLLDIVQNATGAIYEPVHIRRKAKAEADASVIKAEADAIAAIIKAEADNAVDRIRNMGSIELEETTRRAFQRLTFQEIRKQQNIDSIVGKAAKELPEVVSQEKVDEDWATQFFEYAQNVSNEDMQSLWARLLAGEVAKPGSYSFRTLQLVKMLQKSEANLFTHFCSYVWKDQSGKMFYFLSKQTNSLLEKNNIGYLDLVELQQVGLIQMVGDQLHRIFDSGDSDSFSYFGTHYRVTNPHRNKIQIISYLLTVAGQELAPISGAKPDEDFRKVSIETLTSMGLEVQESIEPNSTAPSIA